MSSNLINSINDSLLCSINDTTTNRRDEAIALVKRILVKNFGEEKAEGLLEGKAAVVAIDRQDMEDLANLNWIYNRELSFGRVKELEGLVRTGHWVVGESAFVLSVLGFVINGKTRIAGLRKSGVERAEILLRWDAGMHEYLHMDGGRKRSDADASGYPRATTEAGNCLLAIAKRKSNKVEKAAMYRAIAQHCDFAFSCQSLEGYERRRASPGTLAALAFHGFKATTDEDLDYVYSQWKKIVTGRRDPADKLIETTISDLGLVTKGVESARVEACAIVWFALSQESLGKTRRPYNIEASEKVARSAIKEFCSRILD
jgi:hypothetical protein